MYVYNSTHNPWGVPSHWIHTHKHTHTHTHTQTHIHIHIHLHIHIHTPNKHILNISKRQWVPERARDVQGENV